MEESVFAPVKELKLNYEQTRKYWKRANQNKIPRGKEVFLNSKSFTDNNHARQQDRAEVFEERLMRYVKNADEESQLVIAYYDEGGFLISLYGNMNAIRKMKKDGITTKSDWNFANIGPNAVSVGLEENRQIISVGEENYNLVLQNYAIYFAPILVNEVDPPFSEKKIGGVAAIVPCELANSDYQMLVEAISYNIVNGVHHYQRHYRRYQMSDRGVLTIDRKNRDRPVIRHADQPLFDILEIPEKDYSGRPVNEWMDPLPQNARFWSIIYNMEEVTDLELTLYVQRKKIECIVTTDAYYQPLLEVQGLHFFITTNKWIAGGVSRKMGNSAVQSFETVVGNSAVMKSSVTRARLIANTDSNIIILGESGTGKDVYAQAIHNNGSRKNKPFIAVNCGALSRDLIASELFGYEGGAFTGAKKQGNIGKFELANGGTLFLDEIGELPLDMQATLLRAVEQKKIMRLGGNREIEVDVRIISATNANLPKMIQERQFREDLYYRLSTFELRLPPLRERDNDVIVLAEYFVKRACQKFRRTDIMQFAPETKELLLRLKWPGNVRELQNLMEGIVQLYPDPVIYPEHVYNNIRSVSLDINKKTEALGEPVTGLVTEPVTKGETKPVTKPEVLINKKEKERVTRQGKKADLNKNDILHALEVNQDNRSEAAEMLEIARRTLYRYLKKYGIE